MYINEVFIILSMADQMEDKMDDHFDPSNNKKPENLETYSEDLKGSKKNLLSGIDHNKLAKLVAVVIMGFLFIILIVMIFTGTEDCGTDADCFIERANECNSARFEGTIGDGTIVEYSVEDCVLTKKISEFSDTEPEEVKSFFGEKEMICEYEKGNFNEDLIDGLSLGIDECEGELKDAIIELRLAQLSLDNS